MAENYYELVGKLTWVDVKYYENGTCIVKTFLAQRTNKKDKEGKAIYNTFLITFIDSENSKSRIAELFGENCVKDDYVRIKGYLTIDRFIPKGAAKEVENISLIGRAFNKVEYDEFEKRYVDIK